MVLHTELPVYRDPLLCCDLQPHFASKLVLVGKDLNTVRELLEHADIKMTLKYVHLAPEHKVNAVRKIDWSQQARLPVDEP